jgi:hypothetical protein
MARIGVEFGDKQVFQIDDLAKSSGFGKSRIARAAMQIGLAAIREAATDTRRDEVIAINDLKAVN